MLVFTGDGRVAAAEGLQTGRHRRREETFATARVGRRGSSAPSRPRGDGFQVATRSETVGEYFFGVRGVTLIPVLACAGLGLLLALRQSSNPIGWLFLAAALAGSLQHAGVQYAVWGLFAEGGNPPAAKAGAWFSEWAWVVLIYAIAVFAIVLFPDGRLPSRRWRPFIWFSIAEMVMASVAFMTLPGPMQSGLGIPNPYGLESETLELVRSLVLAAFPVPLLGAVVASVLRFRRGSPLEKIQIRWLAFAAALAAVVFAIGTPIFNSVDPESAIFKIVSNASLVAITAVPVSVAVAILKYRLYQIDVIINRTLVYSILTLVLGGTYLLTVVVLQQALVPITRDSEIAIAGSTLAVAGLFRPARGRIQAFIDRRFYRGRYDARRTLEDFAARLRDEVDLGILSGDLLDVVRSTVAPHHVSLWLPHVEGQA